MEAVSNEKRLLAKGSTVSPDLFNLTAVLTGTGANSVKPTFVYLSSALARLDR